jgi:transglutaminase-like putative cysteine protease
VKFSSIYRASFYLMLFFATLVLSPDTVDNSLAFLYPLAVAVASLVAFLTVDRNPALGLPVWLLNLGALGTALLAYIEYQADHTLLLLSLGHWLVYLQLILTFRGKGIREDWELFLLGVVQVMVGSVINQSDAVGFMLFGWAVLSLWVLGLFFLRREALRAQEAQLSLAHSNAEPYQGLLTPSFLLSAVRVTATTLALGGGIFLLMPRQSGATRTRPGETPAQHLTGFDDEVQLGQLGEILESDNVVMSVEMFDGETGARIVPEGEPLWRGVTMAIYEDGRWFKQTYSHRSFSRADNAAAAAQPEAIIRQQIKLEANDSSVLFSLRPVIEATPRQRLVIDLNTIDGTISRTETRPGSFDYEVKSLKNPSLDQPGEIAPDPYRRRVLLLGIPTNLKPRLEQIAREVIEKNVPPEKRNDVEAKARALESYLRDSRQFGYTLKLEVLDSKIDPVLDFLENRKEGHCEYFASALALLLRSAGIPSRVVNGFKGGDWNSLARVMSVRQKHAHSWVEAYMGETGSVVRSPHWLTLDPTPGTERDQSVARVGGFTKNFRTISDFVRYLWVFYVVGYNADRQNRLIYGPLRSLAADVRNAFTQIGQELVGLMEQVRGLLHFQSASAFISVRGFLVSFVGLFLVVFLVRGSSWLIKKLFYRLSGADRDSDALSTGAAHYRRLAALLTGVGLERPATETQEEFAKRATVFLEARGATTGPVADVPRTVVDAFYRVRFGHLELPPETDAALVQRLDALEANLGEANA